MFIFTSDPHVSCVLTVVRISVFKSSRFQCQHSEFVRFSVLIERIYTLHYEIHDKIFFHQTHYELVFFCLSSRNDAVLFWRSERTFPFRFSVAILREHKPDKYNKQKLKLLKLEQKSIILITLHWTQKKSTQSKRSSTLKCKKIHDRFFSSNQITIFEWTAFKMIHIEPTTNLWNWRLITTV